MLILGLSLLVIACGVIAFGVFASRSRIPLARRRPISAEHESSVGRMTAATTSALESAMARRGMLAPMSDALERAGFRLRPPQLIILVLSGCAVAALLGFLAGGPLLAVLLVLLVPVAVWLLISARQASRRRAFSMQLDDTLQQLSGGLRAGHSLLRAVDALAREADSPTAEEFTRVINATRIGRDLGDAMNETAVRMRSDDFAWVSQAMAIHREVGGDLSRVLDEVGATIRERNQIRRQVAALSAEGRMSAYVLLALPFVVAGILFLTSPGYLLRFVHHPLGFVLMGVAVVMMAIGGFWMTRIVRFRF